MLRRNVLKKNSFHKETKNVGKIAIKMAANVVEQTKFEVAKSMAAQGYSMEEIYKVTGLSSAEIKHVLD